MTPWRELVRSVLSSTAAMSMAGGLLTTGVYVAIKDQRRYARMMEAYSSGNILPPMSENNFEVVYTPRPELETAIRQILSPRFSNEFYLVNGEVGSGKSRILVELVRRMIEEEGKRKKGAPVYVLVNQGRSFPETLGAAVRFQFDEHVSLRFFFDFVMRVHSLPHRDESNRLVRVMDAIETSAFLYMQKYGRPAVIVIDGINDLPEKTLICLMEKAKLWADTNIVKLIFVNNDEEVELFFQKQSSSWSRASVPIFIGDLSREEAISYLGSTRFMENEPESPSFSMPSDDAGRVVDLVGGHLHHLIIFKRDWIRGVPFDDTAEELKNREREKFLHVSRSPSRWKVISTLRAAPEKTMLLSKLIKETDSKGVESLAKQNMIRFIRDTKGIVVTFQSTLTKNVVDEFESAYLSQNQETADAADEGSGQAIPL